MFTTTNLPEMDMNIMLETDINDIKQLCSTYNKYIHNMCNDINFWYFKF